MTIKGSILPSITLLVFLLFIISPTIQAQDNEDGQKKGKLSFRDPEDGAIDISSFMMRPEGFAPIPIIVTEPAVGLGGGVALVFFHPQKKEYEVRVPPNITVVAGLYTENNTWGAGFLHFNVW